MIHYMHLYESPYRKIASGMKTIELRLYDEKRQLIQVGDTIMFTNTETKESLEREVAALHRFASFEELFDALDLLKCGYNEDSVEEASPCDMEKYYSKEKQQKYGVVGIEFSN